MKISLEIHQSQFKPNLTEMPFSKLIGMIFIKNNFADNFLKLVFKTVYECQI
jgi:hypothetical protein